MRIYFTFILLMFLSISNAQNTEINVNIFGNVANSENKEHLEYANVLLRSSIDSTVIASTLTNENGHFTVPTLPGVYTVEIEYIGFRSKQLPNINVEKDYDLGTITLETQNVLDAVQIIAEKSDREIHIDKKVYNIGDNPNALGNNAYQVLGNLPSISFNHLGQITLKGLTNTSIWIDGKPSGLVSQGDPEGLKNLSSDIIEKVEVISNPSAKYYSAGGSIINIILKKKKTIGLNGSINGKISYPLYNGAGANINFMKNKINWFLNYNISKKKYQYLYDRLLQIAEIPNTDSHLISTRYWENEPNRLNQFVRFGGDYRISPKHSATLSFLYKKDLDKQIQTANYKSAIFNNLANQKFDYYYNTIRESNYRENTERDIDQLIEYNVDYTYTPSKEDKLEARISYHKLGESDRNQISTDYGKQTSNSEEFEETKLLQLDFTKQINEKYKLETGFLGSFRKIKNDFNVSPLAEIEPGLRGIFWYNEDVVAGYLSASQKTKNVEVSLGLRHEYGSIATRVEGFNKYIRNNHRILPSLNIAYSMDQSSTLNFSLARDIGRPLFDNLKPFISNFNNKFQKTGNPLLESVIVNKYELSYGKYLNSLYFNVELFGEIKAKQISIVTRFELDKTNAKSIVIPENTGRSYSQGLHVLSTYTGIKNLKVDGDFYIFYFASIPYNTYQLNGFKKLEGFMRYYVLNLKYNITPKIVMRVQNSYTSKYLIVRGFIKPIIRTNVSLNYKLPKKKGSISISMFDIFNSNNYITEITTPTVFEYNRKRGNLRSITASFIYNFKR